MYTIGSSSPDIAPSVYPPPPKPDYDGDDWCTPPEIIELAREVMGGIDLDPAANEASFGAIQAGCTYTRSADGLARPWFGRVWLNPPYSRQLLNRFVDKLIFECRSGCVSEAIVLVNNATETNWFQALLGASSRMCLVKGRLKFWRPDRVSESARQGQVVFYFGERGDRFARVFSTLGPVFVTATRLEVL